MSSDDSQRESYYSQKDIEEIKLIHYLLKERKLKIEGAKQVLKHKEKVPFGPNK